MKFKIRTKLISAFFAMLVPFFIVYTANYFFAKAIHESIHTGAVISYELENLSDLQLALDRLLMPANDYIITADPKERVEFNRLAGEVEKHLALIPMEKRCQQCHQARTTEMVARLYGREASKDMPEEMLVLKEIRGKFEGIKKYGEAIFSLQRPAGSAEAARLMKEMDALGHKVIDGPIGRHRQMEKRDMQKAGEVSEKAWRRFQLGRTLGYLAALILGVIIALIYSGRLASVIKLLHKGSYSIAKGDFKASVDIKTGDEFEQLADGMNEMAAQLDSLYSSLEQKVVERTRELKESNERFDLAVKGTNDGIWDWDIGTNTNYFSPRFMELLDYRPGELSYEFATFEFLLHPEDRAWVFDRVRQHLEDKVPYNVEYRLHTKNGEYKWFQARGEALRDQSGKPFRMAGSITDITERRRAEAQLKNSEERYRRIIQTSMDGFWITDTKGRILDVNDAYCHMIGYAREELLNMSIPDVEAKETPEETEQHIQEVITKGYVRFETRHRRKDGQLLDIEVSAVYRPDAEDGRFFIFLRDITERKQSEEKIKEQLDYLERFQKVALRREFRIKELTTEIDKLKAELEELKKRAS